MIYTDRIHLVSDCNLAELHQFAENIGLHVCWFDWNPNHPHYDFPKRSSGGFTRQQLIDNALALGAIEVSTREIVEITVQMRGEKRFY